MSVGTTPPSSRSATASVRAAFAAWLVRHRPDAGALTIKEMVARSKLPISGSAAYRTALAVGLRGKRFNQTRYATFWFNLNWQLPDAILAEVWGVDRGNLRRRRERMRKGPPRFNVDTHSSAEVYLTAVAREQQRARAFRGPKPY
jgi:hypothetical protein